MKKLLWIALSSLWIAKNCTGQIILQDTLVCFTAKQSDSLINITQKIDYQNVILEEIVEEQDSIMLAQRELIEEYKNYEANILNLNNVLDGYNTNLRKELDRCSSERKRHLNHKIISIGVNVILSIILVDRIL